MREEAIALGRARGPESLKSSVQFKTRNLMLGSTFLPKEENLGIGISSGWGQRADNRERVKSKQVKTLPGSLVPAEQVQTPPSFQGPTQLSSSPFLFTCYIVSNSLRPHRLQHTRLPYPLPSLSVCSNSCPLTR